MPLDGLRAWIGELERKLGARTRIGLVLVALAVGAGGAGIYLALDAASNSVSKDDLRAAQEQLSGGAVSGSPLEARLKAAEAAATTMKSEVAELKTEVKQLKTLIKAIAKSELGTALGEVAGVSPSPEEKESGSGSK
jgi:uncharacterized protein HemX